MRQSHRSFGRKFLIGLLILGIYSLSAANTQAASYDWNPAGGPAGTWDGSLLNWWDSVTSANIAWDNLATSVAVFGAGQTNGPFGAGGAVTVDAGGVTANAMTFNLNGYSLSGGTITLAGTSTITVSNSTDTAVISAPLAGSAFTKAGSGTLTLNGVNTMGAITIARGNLNIGNAAALGTGALTITNTERTLATIDNTGTGGSAYTTLTNNNNINLNGWVRFAGTNNLDFGTGVLTLDNNGHNRTIKIDNGATLSVGSFVNTATLNGPRSMALFGNGTINVGSTGFNIGSLAGTNRQFVLFGTLNMNVTGPVTQGGLGGLTWQSLGTLKMSGTNTYTGTTSLQAGTVVLDYTTNNTNKLPDTVSNLTIAGLANLQLKSNGGANTTEVVPAMSFSSGGTLKLSQDNTASGGAFKAVLAMNAINRANGSTMDLAAASIATTDTNNAGGATGAHIIGGYATVAGADWAVSADTGAADTPITAYAIGSYQTNADSFPWAGTDNVSITGNTTLTASRTINTIKINTSGASSLDIVATQTLSLNAGGLLFVGGDNYEIKNGTLRSMITGTSDLILHAYGAGTLKISSLITNGNGTSVLTKAGPGTVIINNQNTYTGVTFVNEGTLKLLTSTIRDGTTPLTVGVSGPLGPGNSGVTVGGTLDLNGQNLGVGALSGSLGKILNNSGSGTSMLTVGYNNAALNANETVIIADNDGVSTGGSVAVTKVGTGIWQPLIGSTYSGGTWLQGGVVRWGITAGDPNSSAFGSGPVHFQGGQIFTLSNGTGAGGFSLSITNPIVAEVVAIPDNATNTILYNNAFTFSGNFSGAVGSTLQLRNEGAGTTLILDGNLSGFNGTFDIYSNDADSGNVSLTNAAGAPGATFRLASSPFTGAGIQTLQWAGPGNATISLGALSGSVNGILRNNSVAAASTATFQIGALGSNTVYAGTIVDNGTKLTAITKTGAGTLTLSNTNTYTGGTTASNGTLSITGTLGATPLTVNGGNLVLASGSSVSSPSATVNSGGTFTVNTSTSIPTVIVNNGGTLTSTAFTSSLGSIISGNGLTVAGGGTINLQNGSINTLNLTSQFLAPALTLGDTVGSNPASLGFDIGGSSDRIALGPGSTLAVNSTGARININALPGFNTGTYPLITFSPGALTSIAGFSIGTVTPDYPGAYGLSIDPSGTSLDLHVNLPWQPAAWWDGSKSNMWNDTSGGTTNWRINATSNIDTYALPSAVITVYFATQNAVTLYPQNLHTMLGSNFGIKGIVFTSTVGTGREVTIDGTNTLAIGSGGITVDSGSGAHTISTSGLALTGTGSSSTQTWTNNSTNVLTVNAAISGDSLTALELAGGKFFFNNANTYSGGTTIDFGATLQIGNGAALGTGQVTVNGTLNIHGHTLTMGDIFGSGLITNNSAPGSIEFNTSLSYGGFSGIIQDGTGTTSVTKSGTGSMWLSGTNAYSGGTVINEGVLTIADENNLGDDAGSVTLDKTGASQAVLQIFEASGWAPTRALIVGSGGGAIELVSGATLGNISSASSSFQGPLDLQGDGAITMNLSGAPAVGTGASITVVSTVTLNVGGAGDLFTNGATSMDVLNNGNLNITAGVKKVDVLSGTGSTSLSDNTQLTATSVAQNTLTIGAGSVLTIAPIPGGPLSGSRSLSSVPEPSTWTMLVLAAMAIGMYWRRSR